MMEADRETGETVFPFFINFTKLIWEKTAVVYLRFVGETRSWPEKYKSIDMPLNQRNLVRNCTKYCIVQA